MIELSGKYNSAKVFTDIIEPDAISQIITLCSQEISKDSKIRIMPDVHAGTGCTIGTSMTIKDKAVPNMVGVDIGCGMETVKIKEKHIELQKLDKLIYEKIPSGLPFPVQIRLPSRIFIGIISFSPFCADTAPLRSIILSVSI